MLLTLTVAYYINGSSLIRDLKTTETPHALTSTITPSSGFPGNLDSLRFTFKNGATLLGSEKFKLRSRDKLIILQNSNFTGNADMSLEFYAKPGLDAHSGY